MFSRRRTSSPTSSCSCMIRCCSAVGSGGMNSPLDAGYTSTGIRSDRSDQRSRCRLIHSLTSRPPGSVDDFDHAAHAWVDAAVERVDAVLRRPELPVDTVLDPRAVVRLATADLRLRRVVQHAVADFHRLEVHRIPGLTVAAVRDRIVDPHRPVAGRGTGGERVPDPHGRIEVPEPYDAAALDAGDAGHSDDAHV